MPPAGSRLIGAQVDVVVGKHRRRDQAGLAVLGEQQLREAQVERGGHLEVLGKGRHDAITLPPARSTSQASSVASCERRSAVDLEAALEGHLVGTPAASGQTTAQPGVERLPDGAPLTAGLA